MRFLAISLSVISMVFFAYAAEAQVKDKQFKDWSVYTTTLQGRKTCYIASFPVSKTGNYSLRDEPYFLVTNIDANTDEISTSSGYKYKINSDIDLSIQGDNFKLFTKGELAWAPDSQKDKEIIETIKKRGNMTVKGTSVKGTYSVDKYSLMGFSSAYSRMKELCK